MGRKKKTKRKIDELSEKHRNFATSYIQLQNATKAYLQTYPHVKYNTAMVEGCKLLRKPNIKEAIQEYLDEKFKEKETEISNIFNKLVSISNSDIADFIDDDGDLKFKDFKEINTYVVSEYSKIETESENSTNTKQTIKMLDKQKALSELIKILGMITEKTEVSGTIVVAPAVRPQEEKSSKKNKKEIDVKIAQRPE